ncbi:MAG: site-specific DNA-methyltransferase [Butyrivibrio sp.]|nr:site-specific DNA-methyltransferase [Butyrivibrio sp.]
MNDILTEREQLEIIKKRMIEAGISSDEIGDLLSPLQKMIDRRVCGLVWEHTKTSIPDSILKGEKLPILEPDLNKNIITDKDTGINHVLIEGDNLLALMTMQYTHIDSNRKGKVDVIYIDPPYNTESTTLSYNDKFEKSEWLSMLDIRLKLAKNLLTDKGVIFVSIDDRYQAELKMLMNDIFGSENFVAQMIVASNSTKNNAKLVSVSHEYVVCYAKGKQNVIENGEWAVKKNNVDEYCKRAKALVNRGLSAEEIHQELLELVKYPRFYDFDHFTYADEKDVYETDNPGGVKNGNTDTVIYHPVTKKPCPIPNGGWRYKEEELLRLVNEGLMAFGEDETIIPRPKRYLHDYLKQIPKSTLFFDSQGTTKWLKAEKFDFEYPKPVALIKHILSIFDDDITVLDFYAGSGTTGHAVMELNAEDGGHRKFILCTNNELGDSAKKKAKKDGVDEDMPEWENYGVCSAVTYPRLKLIMTGKREDGSDYSEGYKSNNLYFYKIVDTLEESAIDEITRNNLAKQAVSYIALKENVFDVSEKDDYHLLSNQDTEIMVVLDPYMDEFEVEDSLLPGVFSKTKRKVYCAIEARELKDTIEYVPYPDEVLEVLKAAKKYVRRETR